jgi:hypothetical protein
MTTADKAAIAATGIAAVAAVASWASVWQSSRFQRRALEPRVNVQASELLAPSGDNQIRLRIQNTGGGFAQEAMFWIKEGDHVAMGGVPPYGALAPGEGVTVSTDLRPANSHETHVLVIWRYGTRTYAQAGAPSHRKSWSRRKWAFWGPKSNQAIVSRFFPSAGPAASWKLVGWSRVG